MNKKKVKGHKFFNFNQWLLAGVLILSVVIFIIDISLPLGIAGGIPYALVVMATYWHKAKRITILSGFMGTVLIIAGYFYSETSEYVLMAGVNRMISIAVIWACVWFVNNYKSSLMRIQKNEKRISALFEAATEGIIISNLNGDIVMVNEMIEELFGYERKVLLGQGIEMLVPGRYRSEHRDYRREYNRDPEPRPMGQGRDLFGLKKDGKEFPVEISLNYFDTDEGRFVISYVIDITQRKTAEDNLLQAHEELKQKAIELKLSNEELEQFAYVASHDLQEPLRMVASYTQLLARRYGDKLDEDARDFINYAVDGARRMQQLLNDLLQFSRIGTEAKPFQKIPVREVLDDAMLNLKKYIEEHNAEIHIESSLPELSVDKLQLTQLFQNLIHNAVKFRGDTQPEVWIQAVEKKDHWEFCVSDNGVGIEEKHQGRIFMIFQRLHKREEYDGSGIGLAICKKIVGRHGGDIWVDSTPGEGTAFYFTIAKGLKTHQKQILNEKEKSEILNDK